ncbi:hypothetical protein GP486_005483 [Trichoglossum hirsutum]|uniref:Hsp70 family protein n=1 Tax=Trichoglossum hirsutum TaxID=265104 RepID=A0A9P8L9B1_9PEZI|nr:hypothetical protein GP486_005483 [Trichoglossum hirsutum]
MEVADPLPEVQERRLVIAVDYGTTYTGVALAVVAGNSARQDDIIAIDSWGPGMANHEKIPSVISYSKAIGPEWGASVDKKSVAMVHTKLQLEVSSPSEELDLILQALEGMHDLDSDRIRDAGPLPAYTWKGPEAIVEDYLTRMLESLLRVERGFSKQMRRHMPVDIVVTIPAGWSYRAKNSIFRALSQAGFNRKRFPKLREMLLVSEPEAAAAYTARYFKELDPEFDDEIDDEFDDEQFLRKDECFVLCDAGGGTVDTISYQVKQLRPTFEITPVTKAIGYKCGSVFIDIAFKSWLREFVGEDNYLKLDPAQARDKITSFDREGERMRELMAAFNILKRKFEKGHQDMKMDFLTLPEPLHNLNLHNKVEGGQIIIT